MGAAAYKTMDAVRSSEAKRAENVRTAIASPRVFKFPEIFRPEFFPARFFVWLKTVAKMRKAMHEIDSVSCWPIDLLRMFSSQNIQQIQVFIKSQREVLYYFLINFLINCMIFSAIVDQWDNYAYRTSLVESKLNCVLSYRWILLFFHQSFRDKPFLLDQESNARPFLFRKRTTLPALLISEPGLDCCSQSLHDSDYSICLRQLRGPLHVFQDVSYIQRRKHTHQRDSCVQGGRQGRQDHQARESAHGCHGGRLWRSWACSGSVAPTAGSPFSVKRQ